MKRLRVLFVQLPILYPLVKITENPLHNNQPLAAGYLTAMARQQGLAGRVDFEILDATTMDLSGDARLIDAIALRRPDLLCFSLYSWNTERSLHIARQVKRILPNVLVVVGGPEVSAKYSKHLFGDGIVDLGVIGEGERVFVEFLEPLLSGRSDWRQINGVCFPAQGSVVATPPSVPVERLEEIPSPLLTGVIDPTPYRRIWIETMRWCPLSCKFCMYSVRSRSRKPIYALERIRAELELARAKGIRLVNIHDSCFNVSPIFEEVCEVIRELNHDRWMALHAEVLAEPVDARKAQWLAECNFTEVEVGLQSTNPSVLKLIRRPFRAERWLQGVNLLRERGIQTVISIILGLPGQTLETIQETIRFLTRHGLNRLTRANILSVFPQSELRGEAESLGLVFQPMPSYRVIKTPTLSFEQLQSAIALCDRELAPREPQPSLTVPSLATYSQGAYPSTPMTVAAEGPFEALPTSRPVTKVVFDLGSGTPSPAELSRVGAALRRRLASTVTVWFRCAEVESSLRQMTQLLAALASDNPYGVWELVVESIRPWHPRVLHELTGSIPFKAHNMDYEHFYLAPHEGVPYVRRATRVVVLLPFPRKLAGPMPWRASDLRVDWLWTVRVASGSDLEAVTKALAIPEGPGLLVEFHPQLSAAFIAHALDALNAQNRRRKAIRFRNWAIQRTWDARVTGRPLLRPPLMGGGECIVTYTERLERSTVCFDDQELSADLLQLAYLSGRAAEIVQREPPATLEEIHA